MTDYVQKELLATLFAVGVTVLVAVAADLASIESFETVSLSGIAVTAIRSLGTAIVFVGSKYMVNRG